MIPTYEQVRELFEYEPDTGLLWRKMRESRRHKEPWRIPAGTKSDKGYLLTRVGRRGFGVHRIAWLWMTGNWPKEQIDHIDRDRSNNKWSNLREATQSQNQANSKARSTNKAGLKGAHYYYRGDCWSSRICSNGQRYFLGYFKTAEAAHMAYCSASQKLNGQFARFA